jgi:hypothetical protein
MKAAKKSKNRTEDWALEMIEKKKRKQKKCLHKGGDKGAKNRCGKGSTVSSSNLLLSDYGFTFFNFLFYLSNLVIILLISR